MRVDFLGMTLNNFKAFKGRHKITLSRAPGLYFVSGKNLGRPELGANAVGKSSLWDALYWCLYGKTVRDNRPSKNVVSWGERPSETYVKVGFLIGAVRHMLTRHASPAQVTHTVGGESRVIESEEVSSILGWSEVLFRRAVLFGQFGEDEGPRCSCGYLENCLVVARSPPGTFQSR